MAGTFDHIRPAGGFKLLLADPAWRFENYSKKGEKKSAGRHYDCMPLDQLKALPVETLAAVNSALLMWATFPMLIEAIALMAAWGFAYKTAAPWAKQSKTGKSWAFGTGYIFRSAAEILLLGTRGNPRTLSRSVRNLIVAPVREHSRKPDVVYEMAEALFPEPRCELFARQQRPGWVAWGNETDKFQIVQ